MSNIGPFWGLSVSQIELNLPEREPEAFSYLKFVYDSIVGVAVGGFVFPLVVAGYLTFRFIIPETLRYGVSTTDIFAAGISIFGFLFLTTIIGFVIAIFSGWICGLFLCAVNYSLGNPLSPKIFISCVGGLAGFATLALLFIHPDSLNVYREGVEAFLVGPCLAALVGQTGVRWWARDRVLYPDVVQKSLPVAQFQIAHVLALTGWLAGTLAILRLATDTNLPLIVALYFPVQIVCLGFGRLIDNYADWKSGIRFVG